MDPAAPLPPELVFLGWSVVLLIVQVLLQGGLANAELGLTYNASPRDAGLQPQSPHARRAERALRNFLETYPAFVGLALALVLVGRVGGWGAIGAMIWFWARLIYVPLYVFGVPYIRSLVWFVSLVGLAMMLGALGGWLS